jgi:transposase
MYCGIDLHSTNSYVSIITDQQKVVKAKRVPNDLGEVLGLIEPYRAEIQGIAIESTWNWYWLADGLMDAGYRVHLTNTLKAKQYEGLKYSDDRSDARWLAHMLSQGSLPEGYIYPKEDRAIRDLLRRRTFLVQTRSSLLVALRGGHECRTGTRVTAREVKSWTVDDVTQLAEDEDIQLQMSCLIASIHELTKQILKIERHVVSRSRLREEYKLLQTVWGIGKILALTVMYEVGDIRRFPSVSCFASYSRCVKSRHMSNGKQKGKGNVKSGNPYLSWAFSEAATFAKRFREPARRFYARKQARTHAIVANRALAHKLARATYHVLRDQVPFDPVRTFGPGATTSTTSKVAGAAHRREDD